MADDQNRTVIICNHFLQQIQRFKVEVVCGFVEHQQIGLTREFARQQNARLLATR